MGGSLAGWQRLRRSRAPLTPSPLLSPHSYPPPPPPPSRSESAEPSRIRDRHRKMLMANHPDAGGSTFLSTKINAAKELLLKGTKQ